MVVMSESEFVESLVNEYTNLFQGQLIKDSDAQLDQATVVKQLADSADWSLPAAHELVRLAEDYGAFMLRNALAVAVVLGKEDGSLGF
jgi:hypothetical protein